MFLLFHSILSEALVAGRCSLQIDTMRTSARCSSGAFQSNDCSHSLWRRPPGLNHHVDMVQVW
jgi:hypothetical protein